MGKDDLLFADETMAADYAEDRAPAGEPAAGSIKWKLLVVDDEEAVHATTRLVLNDFEFEGKRLDILSANTGTEALDIMRTHDDIAVVLLDVVMETNQAGLDCARAIRKDLKNKLVRIVLRTGQPGNAPERQVIIDYDINDYKNKAELTSQQLFTTVYTAIRSYRDMAVIDKQRRGLQYIINASGDFFRQNSIKTLARGVLTQIEALFRLRNSVYVSGTGFSAYQEHDRSPREWELISATGKYEPCETEPACDKIDDEVIGRMQAVAEKKKSRFFSSDYVAYFPTRKNKHHIVYMEGCGKEGWGEIEELLEVFTTNVGIAFDNIYLNEEIVDTQTEIIMRLGQVVESRSKETAYHVVRVAEYTYVLAKALGLDEREAGVIKLASPMHDIGKIGIPDNVLLKPGKLTDEEFELIKTHTEIGYSIFEGSARDVLKTAAIIAISHHERWDGKGYPKGLKGEDIPLPGRLVQLADVFDALGCDRVYKKAWPLDRVFEFIEKERGKMFDPSIVDTFFANRDELLSIREQYRDRF